MSAFSRQPELTDEVVAREAYALAKVLRLLGHAPGQAGQGGAAADPELAQIAEQLDMIARKPGQLDIALTTLDRALELAEQTAKRLRQEVRGGLRQRIDRTLRRSEMRSDPVHLADELVARLQQQHKVIASQLGH